MNKCWSIKKNKSHKKNNQNKEVVNQRASHHLLLLVLMLFIIFEPTLTSSSSSTFQQVQSSASTKTSVMSTKMESDNIKILFSDVDGTLVHYPEAIITTTEDNIDAENGNRILKLPPSATGMQGIISSNTLKTCQDIRKQGVKLVIVSGMRTSTLLKRLPYLPLADAYCSEAGGRIFYARSNHDPTINNIKNVPTYTATPKKYDGADPADLKPFTIVEDMEWRREMEQPHAAGTDGYVGAEINLLQDSSNSNVSHPIPVSERAGKLWEFAHKLTAKGFVLDTKGYSTCFRVNKKQQTSVSQEDFERLLRGECIVACPTELATSTNLGCIDYYPVASGKKKCCEYLATKFCGKDANSNSEKDNSSLLSKHAVCACDDDNDLEMALACHHAYIPGVSSTSMAVIIQNNPGHFTQTGGHGASDMSEGTAATEKALSLLLERIKTS